MSKKNIFNELFPSAFEIDRVVVDEDFDGNYEVYFSNPQGDHLDDIGTFETRQEASKKARSVADELQLGLVELL